MTTREIVYPGEGRGAVLLLHGLTGMPVEMASLARAFARQGFAVRVPLLAGHGSGKRALLATGWRDWLAGCETAFDELAATHRRVHVGGVCAGAALAVLLTARRPAASLVTLSMTFRYDGWSLPRISRAAPLIQHFVGLPGLRGIGFAERPPFGIKDERRRRRLVHRMAAADTGMLDHFPLGSLGQLFRMGREVRRVAPAVRAPSLLVHARDDDMASLSNSISLHALLGGSKRLMVLDDSYHLVHLDRQSREVEDMATRHVCLADA